MSCCGCGGWTFSGLVLPCWCGYLESWVCPIFLCGSWSWEAWGGGDKLVGNLHVPHDPFVAGGPSHDRLEHLQQLLRSDDCDVVLDQVWSHIYVGSLPGCHECCFWIRFSLPCSVLVLARSCLFFCCFKSFHCLLHAEQKLSLGESAPFTSLSSGFNVVYFLFSLF